ncbi:MAG TPA: R3H domain-containing nucleic acid-binding protein [Chloroflexota bacterium]|nr:R3H domain-containing nucleic acid-binding protein [Chloroflexota bacterium]
MIEQEQIDDIHLLLDALPPHICDAVQEPSGNDQLLEVVMDLGREPTARFRGREIQLSPIPVSEDDISYVTGRIGAFGDDNRAGIERTLHRISAIRNRTGKVIGLTCRVGRAVFGTIAIIRDIVESGKSILLLGKPGVGKTTLLREMARVLADDLGKRVIVVDTSNEIAGDGDIPHPGIGRSRRMQVSTPLSQHAVMIEAVENHMPEVIVIDEIGTELEALAARTIAERGVQLIGTAHGNTLDNLMQNPTLSDLIGGIQTVTLSDEEARRRGTQKSVLERKAPPTFDVVVEIQDWHHVIVHPDVARTVDNLLLGRKVQVQVRQRDDRTGQVTMTGQELAEEEALDEMRDVLGLGEELTSYRVPGAAGLQPLRIYPFGVSRPKLEQAIRDMRLPVTLVRDIDEADLLLTLKNYYRRKPPALRDAESHGKPVYVLKNNTMAQMQSCLAGIYDLDGARAAPGSALSGLPSPNGTPMMEALQEAEDAITSALDQGHAVDLAPQNSYVRRLQHRLAERYNLSSRSRGKEPNRHVRIFPAGTPRRPDVGAGSDER